MTRGLTALHGGARLGPGMGWLADVLGWGGHAHAHHVHAGLGALFLMWAAMAVAMMLPVASPVIVAYAGIARQGRGRADVGPVTTAAFAAGYLLVWLAFAALAAPAQWGLREAALLSPAMAGASPVFSGAVLVLAGLYQWSPAKHACLHRCRTPLQFFLTRWRQGWRGAIRMGAEHGAFCLGCCWALMALMYVVGVMNLLWIGLLALLMYAERAAPGGERIARVAGVALVLWGGALLAVPGT